MKLAIMQPYFFPYIGYFQLIHAVDKIIFYDHLHYIKHGWINRNRILELHKADLYITVPLKKCSSNKLIKEIEIDNTGGWQKKMCIMIRYNYARSPFFNRLYPVIEDLICRPCRTIAELNFRTIQGIVSLLDLPAAIVYGSDDYIRVEEELKACPSPSVRKVQRIFSIAKQERADVFVNAIGGQALYDKALFHDNGIELYFLQTYSFSYPQPSPVFYPNLSILDVLFNCGIQRTQALLSLYTLV